MATWQTTCHRVHLLFTAKLAEQRKRRMGLQLVQTDLKMIRMDRLDDMVAERVQHVLAKRGIGLNDLVKHVDMPAAVLKRRLAADSSFTLCELARIAAFAGCRTAELIPGMGEK